jgi:hypothetical protein
MIWICKYKRCAPRLHVMPFDFIARAFARSMDSSHRRESTVDRSGPAGRSGTVVLGFNVQSGWVLRLRLGLPFRFHRSIGSPPLWMTTRLFCDLCRNLCLSPGLPQEDTRRLYGDGQLHCSAATPGSSNARRRASPGRRRRRRWRP